MWRTRHAQPVGGTRCNRGSWSHGTATAGRWSSPSCPGPSPTSLRARATSGRTRRESRSSIRATGTSTARSTVGPSRRSSSRRSSRRPRQGRCSSRQTQAASAEADVRGEPVGSMSTGSPYGYLVDSRSAAAAVRFWTPSFLYACSRCFATVARAILGIDVLVEPEEVGRVVGALELDQTLVVSRAVGLAHPVAALFAEEVHVHAAPGVLLHRVEEVLRPGDVEIGARVFLGPDRVYVDVVGGIALAEGHRVLTHSGQRSAELK